MLEEREKYIREFFDSLSDEEFVAMLLECGIERTKRASESDYVKTFCLDEKEIRGEKMSYWSFVHGTVTVLPFGRTQAEKRYLLDTVLDHLPKVTGSEGDMNIYLLENHRSTKSIIDFANKINSLNKNRVVKDLIPTREKGESVIVEAFEKKNEEEDHIVSIIKEKIDEGHPLEDIAYIASTRSQLLKMGTRLTEEGIQWIMLNEQHQSVSLC